jgi:nitronate monooxygenase
MWAGQAAALAEALPAGELIEKIIHEFLAVTASLQLK